MAITYQESQTFYEDFSLAVGERDWLSPNPRHIQLKLLIRQVLRGQKKDLRIADVGCGCGVMTDYLTRYGTVVGVDFSTAAITAATARSTARFYAGGLEALAEGDYDLITLFDVLEHIALSDRPEFIAGLAARLKPTGLLFCSTPFPSSTRRRKEVGDPTLQIIDEEVELPAVVREAAAAGLQLLTFTTYDVFSGSPEYQAFVFSPEREGKAEISLQTPEFRWASKILTLPSAQVLRRVYYSARAARHGNLKTASWFLTAKPPDVAS